MKEQEMLEPVRKLFSERGCFSENEYGIEITAKNPRVDVFAFKWVDNWEIKAIAVECKLGKTWEGVGQALGQATAYQTLFPEVYIASQAEDLGHVESILRQLGLGYIQVASDSAEEIFPPSENIRFNKKKFVEQIRNTAAMLLSFSSVFESEGIQWGVFRRTWDRWISTKGYVQIHASTHGEGVGGGINIEKLPTVRRTLEAIDVARFWELVQEMPDDARTKYYLGINSIESYRPVMKRTERVRKCLADLESPESLAQILNQVKENWQFHIQFNIRATLWDQEELIPRDKCMQSMQKMKDDLWGLFQYLSDGRI